MNTRMDARDLTLVLTVILLWGFNIAVVKTALSEMPPLFFISLRFLAAAALLAPFYRVPREKIGDVALLALVLGIGHFGFLFAGLAKVDASAAIILIQLEVPFAALLAALWLKESISLRAALGIAVAMGGVAVVAGNPDFGHNRPYLLMIILSAFFWAAANPLVKKLSSLHILAINGWMSLFAAPPLLLASWLLEDGQTQALAAASAQTWAALGYTTVTLIAGHGLWYWLLHRHPINHLVPFTLLLPVVGVVSAALLLGEAITPRILIGGAMTVFGLALVTIRRNNAA